MNKRIGVLSHMTDNRLRRLRRIHSGQPVTMSPLLFTQIGSSKQVMLQLTGLRRDALQKKAKTQRPVGYLREALDLIYRNTQLGCYFRRGFQPFEQGGQCRREPLKSGRLIATVVHPSFARAHQRKESTIVRSWWSGQMSINGCTLKRPGPKDITCLLMGLPFTYRPPSFGLGKSHLLLVTELWLRQTF